MARTVLTEEERSQLGFIALELAKIRKQLLQLAETLVKISDKQFLETFNVTKEEFTEKQLDNYQLTLQKQADKAESEF
ncbi:MAG: hypothetical protein ACFCUE_06880 [Candidatus Bathyarchaeia archaeon]